MNETITQGAVPPVQHWTDMQLHVVGMKHYITDAEERQRFIDSAPSARLIMACEPNNRYDHEAIAVYTIKDNNFRLVAYISRENLPKAHLLMQAMGKSWMPIHALGVQLGRHTTLEAYPLSDDDEMIMDIATDEETNASGLSLIDIGGITLNVYNNQPSDTSTATQLAPAAPSAEVRQSAGSYYDCEEFRNGIIRVTDFISKKKATWSLVYFFLRKHGFSEMCRSRFGEFVHEHGGPSARTVRDSGNYELRSYQLLGEKDKINAIAAFFPGI